MADRLMMVPGTNRIIRIPDDPLYGDDGRCRECGEWPGGHAKICTRGGIREVWACPDHATGDRMRSLRSLAQLVQWALEGIIDGGVVGTDEPEAVHGQIKRIKHALGQLLEDLNPDEED